MTEYAPLLASTLPSPLDPLIDAGKRLVGVGNFVTDPAGTITGSIFGAVMSGVGDACRRFGDGVLSAITTPGGVDFRHGWWAGERGQQLMQTVGMLAASLLVCFLLLALIQGLYSGEPTMMLRAFALEAPVAVFGMTAVAVVADLLLGLTDAASSAVLAGAGDSVDRFLHGFGTAANLATSGYAALIMLLIFLFGALLVWVELVIRASMIYFLVAAAPLFLAARVWPAAKGSFRKLCELGVALIVSKFFIALALALGAAALGGGGPKDALGTGQQAGADLAGLLTGGTLMLLAAFAPFIIVKLLPVMEAAVVAQGVSRGPWRATTTGMQGVYYAQGVTRMAGGSSGRVGASSGQAPEPSDGGGAGPDGGPKSGGGVGGGGAAEGAATSSAGGPAGAAIAGVAAAGKAAVRRGGETADAAAEAGARQDTSSGRPGATDRSGEGPGTRSGDPS